VEGDLGAQFFQGRNQDGGGGLPVHIKVAPYTDFFSPLHGLFQTFDRQRHARQFVRRGWAVVMRVEESPGLPYRFQASPGEHLRHQGMPADGALQVCGYVDLLRLNPTLSCSLKPLACFAPWR
jgi:hypothetical protein